MLEVIVFYTLFVMLLLVTYQYFILVLFLLTSNIILSFVGAFFLTLLYSINYIKLLDQTKYYSTKQKKVINEVCLVCLEEVTDGFHLHCSCKNTYHEKCLTTWVSMKNTCPTCRTILVHQH